MRCRKPRWKEMTPWLMILVYVLFGTAMPGNMALSSITKGMGVDQAQQSQQPYGLLVRL